MPINTCIIGISGFGRVHYKTLLREWSEGHVDLVGATVINQDEEREKCTRLRDGGCRIYDDYRQMLSDLCSKADLCVIPTGIPWHRVMTEAALETGMHVLVEKPAAGCIQDVRLMQESSRLSGKRVAVGYQHMYADSTLETKRAILNGIIGDLRLIKCFGLWPRGSTYYHRNNWVGRIRINDTWVLDSPISNALSHYLMMMLFLAGPSELKAATPVFVEGELYQTNDIESADTACMRIQTDMGVPVLFYVTHACSQNIDPEIQVHGAKGTILLQYGKAVVEYKSGSRNELSMQGLDDIRQRIMQAVYAMIRGGTSFYCDLELASKPVIAVNAIHEACCIHPVEGKTIIGKDNDRMFVISGIEKAVEKAFQDEKLFHESGVSWARPAGSFDCNNYRIFKDNDGAIP